MYFHGLIVITVPFTKNTIATMLISPRYMPLITCVDHFTAPARGIYDVMVDNLRSNIVSTAK